MREEIRDLQQKLGLTAVYVTHDQEEALAVSDVIVVMSQARIAQSGSPAELYDQPATRFVADFIGGANLLPCEVGPHRDGVATCRLGPLAFDLPHRGIAAGGTTLAVRPHAIRLHTHPAADRLPARIRKATYLGSHIEFTLDSDVGELFAIASAGDGVQVSQGASVHASLGPGGLALVRD
jgi:iron(III) transport system ATP-binding protein